MADPLSLPESAPSDARIPVTLAWRNATRHRRRFAMTVAGVAAAVFLMVFQGSLLFGFIRAAGRVVHVAGGDVWLVPRGVPCFDFAARMPRRYLDLARQIEGVEDVLPLAAGLTTLVRTDGGSQAVLLVGADPRFSQDLPHPASRSNATLDRTGIVIDASNRSLLGVTRVPTDIEIAGRRADVVRVVSGFGSFLGSPYVFGELHHARDILRFGPDEVSYGVVFFRRGTVSPAQLQALRRRLPNVDVLTTSQFASRSAWFWLIQTGAGGAILVAALLGFVVGLVIVMQTMYASTIESLAEFATLKALGASARSIQVFIAMQALLIGVLGATAGLVVLDPLVALARRFLVAWVETPATLRVAGAVTGMFICAVAALSASSTATRADPVSVLRG
jgi:putative ABC transport system permease protein